jgi:hypothetical protein
MGQEGGSKFRDTTPPPGTDSSVPGKAKPWKRLDFLYEKTPEEILERIGKEINQTSGKTYTPEAIKYDKLLRYYRNHPDGRERTLEQLVETEWSPPVKKDLQRIFGKELFPD